MGVDAIPTMGRLRWMAPVEPSKGASPNGLGVATKRPSLRPGTLALRPGVLS